MHTIRTAQTFNARTQKSRVSSGWSHNVRYYSFERQHRSVAPFVAPKSADRLGDAIVGVIALAALLAVLLLIGGAI
jgi:hypothetical protein